MNKLNSRAMFILKPWDRASGKPSQQHLISKEQTGPRAISNAPSQLMELSEDENEKTPVMASRVFGPLCRSGVTSQGNSAVHSKEKDGIAEIGLSNNSQTSSKALKCLGAQMKKPALDSFSHTDVSKKKVKFSSQLNQVSTVDGDSNKWRSTGRKQEGMNLEGSQKQNLMGQDECVSGKRSYGGSLDHLQEGDQKRKALGKAHSMKGSRMVKLPEPIAKRQKTEVAKQRVQVSELENVKDESGHEEEVKTKRARLAKRRVLLDSDDEDKERAPPNGEPVGKRPSPVNLIDLSGAEGSKTSSDIVVSGGQSDVSGEKKQEAEEEEEDVVELVSDELADTRAGRHFARLKRKGEAEADAEFEDAVEDGDPVLAALRTCEGIAAELRDKLHSASKNKEALTLDRFAEVDETSMQLVSQEDVSAACGGDHVQLKPYQLVGVNFLLLLFRHNVGGAILADEMGLGKTVQAITFLALLAHLEHDPGPHLVVAPASLLENWQRELICWCPGFTTVLYHGSERTAIRHRLLSREVSSKAGAGFNVMLTCYSLFERDSAAQKDDRKFLKKWDFSCVLMDEAHLLKDRSTRRTARLRSVAGNARHRLMLTGTPLQNDLQELWSLLEFLMPAIFNTRGNDLSEYLGSREDGGAVATGGGHLIGRIKGILGPFVLRRVKADVMKQLVAKNQQVELVEMVPEQKEAYHQAVEEYRKTVAARSAAKSAPEELTVVDLLPKRQVANIFTHLRKLANHPLLVRRLYTDEALARIAPILHGRGAFGFECTVQRVLEEIREYSDFSIHRLCAHHKGALENRQLSDKAVMASGKCKALAQLLPKLKEEGHRPLIFSQWTAMLDILEWALDVLNLPYVRLDGSTQVSERQALVDSYNSDPEIFAFLLSTRAGGQGLNLTGADTVVLHDVDFNPQVDRQAEDRCHRIGQTKPVTVYRLVAKGTVDENILSIAQRKLNLDAAILDSSGDDGPGTENDSRTMGDILSMILGAKEHQ